MKLQKLAGITLSVAMTLTMVGAVHAADDAMMMEKDAMMMKKDGMMMKKTMYKKGMATWLHVPDAERIHFFYKVKGEWHWQHAIRDMSGNSTSATVGYLDGSKHYVWSALVKKTNGTWMWTPEMHLDTMPM